MKKFPKSLGACADRLSDVRDARLAAEKHAATIKEEEIALKEHIINNLPKGDTGAVGKHHKVIITRKPKPQVKDWAAFYAYVGRTKAFDLLQRRLSDTAIMDRLENKKPVPGIEIFHTIDISLTKVK